MRYLAIDLGDKRTGIAIGSDDPLIVSPLTVLEVPAGPQLLDAIIKVIDEQGPGAVVIGLPLNMDGSEGPAARAARQFGDALARSGDRIGGLPVHFQDERLTSHAAEEHLKQSGRTHRQKKELRDALAAAEILRDFLNARP